MKKVKIQDLKPGLIKGVEVVPPDETPGYTETYFEWTASPLVTQFQSAEISGGILRAWRHTPVFTEIETHVDNEMFYFLSGEALMLFADLQDGRPDVDTACVVRIRPGTQITIATGKAHFVPVAADSEPVLAIVVSPKMDAPRMLLSEPVAGVQ